MIKIKDLTKQDDAIEFLKYRRQRYSEYLEYMNKNAIINGNEIMATDATIKELDYIINHFKENMNNNNNNNNNNLQLSEETKELLKTMVRGGFRTITSTVGKIGVDDKNLSLHKSYLLRQPYLLLKSSMNTIHRIYYGALNNTELFNKLEIDKEYNIEDLL